MSVGDSAEHDELRQVVRAFLSERSPSREVRRLMEAGECRDDQVWALLAGQLGLTGIAVPERYGGAGYGPVELGIVLEEMGGALLVAPYFATVALAGQALAASGDEDAMARWLPGIADGSLTATLAVAEDSGSWDLADVAATAEPAGDGWAVTGTKLFVIDGHTADLLLVVAHAPDGPGVFAVERGAAGVRAGAARRPGPDPRPRLRHPAPGAGRPGRRRPGRGGVAGGGAGPGTGRAGGRAARRRRPLPGPVGRLRQGPRAVRPSDRLVPGHQAQVREPAARGRVRPVGGAPRERGRRRRRSRTRRWPRRSPTSTARRPSPTPPRSASRSTAASATPGSTTRTCTCGGRSRRSCCSARPPGSGRGWPSWPGSEGRR